AHADVGRQAGEAPATVVQHGQQRIVRRGVDLGGHAGRITVEPDPFHIVCSASSGAGRRACGGTGPGLVLVELLVGDVHRALDHRVHHAFAALELAHVQAGGLVLARQFGAYGGDVGAVDAEVGIQR